ncbi:hypothetical protein CEXT_670311 [Caerostris extrusa]|uniref:Uncharacterized protein n=1 Tax=Caerostris extrusa TaxID=172846 RepID=A0AAV4QH67_CAEEX|nr:hypothetical protein CEXT_670311 [Caerostris extrusa]
MTTILESTEQMLANYQSEIHQNLTYDDFSELLNFPFHEYLTNENEVADSHATGNINIEVSTGEKWEGQPKKRYLRGNGNIRISFIHK